MLIKVPKSYELTSSAVTDERLFNSRRKFLKSGVYAGVGIPLALYFPHWAQASITQFSDRFTKAVKTMDVGLEPTSYKHITQYNNFYELGSSKSDPAANASALVTDPWSVKIEGECLKPGTLTLEDLLKPHQFEERIYRLRCVEAWSAVIPWVGFPLSDLLRRFEPTSDAKFVAFETIYDPDNPLPGQRIWGSSLKWPYREGLRMDEAMHPLTLVAVGIYGKPLLNQNGAPLRLVVPWKYGFKSIKSIVSIRFTKTMPPTAWNMQAPNEYGFYSNVNPEVSHPRWSQASERPLGAFFKKKTLKFNGYEEEVGTMYAGMDLKKHY